MSFCNFTGLLFDWSYLSMLTNIYLIIVTRHTTRRSNKLCFKMVYIIYNFRFTVQFPKHANKPQWTYGRSSVIARWNISRHGIKHINQKNTTFLRLSRLNRQCLWRVYIIFWETNPWCNGTALYICLIGWCVYATVTFHMDCTCLPYFYFHITQYQHVQC